MPSTWSQPADRTASSMCSKLVFRSTSRSPNAASRRPDALDGARIGVEAQQPAVGAGGLQDPEGVPSAADGPIDLEAARAW